MKTVAMTIGPIGATIAQAKTPGMLWYASAVFSRLALLLCRNLKKAIPEAVILAPYVPEEDLRGSGFAPDGIGKYHDRVIAQVPEAEYLTQTIHMVVYDSKQDLAEMISRDRNGFVWDQDVRFLHPYFQVPFVILEETQQMGENPLLSASPYLDALEQMRTFPPDNAINPFNGLFGSGKGSIKTCAMLQGVEDPQLIRDGKFRSTQDIARCGRDVPGYYAVLQADGDDMGRYLKTLPGNRVAEFSENCIRYAAAVSRIVADYGGMTVYAGGDDLLALVPLHGNGKQILQLCQEVRDCFDTLVGQGQGPTLSMGVAIRAERFPLYEALSSASQGLFAVAKGTAGKNCVLLDVQSAGGIGYRLAVPGEKLGWIQSLVEDASRASVFQEAGALLGKYRVLLETALQNPDLLEHVLVSLTEDPALEAGMTAIARSLYGFAWDDGRRIRAFRQEEMNPVEAFSCVLRLCRRLLKARGDVA